VESIYLSAASPRWSPTTEHDLRSALDAGLLEETHYLELKRELEPGKAKNREHARDLASFAIDGGTILVGIQEDKSAGVLSLAPQPLQGLRERVESIARTIPDPPLSIITRAVPSADDTGVGYLVVHVPPSASAPHMVDNRYLGRGDSAKHYLSDPEVLRLHELRRQREDDAITLLAREFDRDPVPEAEQKQAHLFLLAEPLAPRPEMMLPYLHHQELLSLLTRGAWGDEATRALGAGEKFSPELSAATTFTRRAAGGALSTQGLLSDRFIDTSLMSNWEDIVELEVSEDGAIRIMMGRLSDALPPQDGAEAVQVLFDAAAVIYTRRLLGLVLEVADRAGYFGGWALAIGATRLRGLSAYDPSLWASKSSFEDDTYERATIASYTDLVAQPGSLADRLLGRFLRKLSTYARYTQELSNPPAPNASDD
jgi:hypothetical protein